MDKLNEYIEALNRGLALLFVHEENKYPTSIKRGDGFIPLSPFLTYFTRDESGAHRLSPVVENLFLDELETYGEEFQKQTVRCGYLQPGLVLQELRTLPSLPIEDAVRLYKGTVERHLPYSREEIVKICKLLDGYCLCASNVKTEKALDSFKNKWQALHDMILEKKEALMNELDNLLIGGKDMRKEIIPDRVLRFSRKFSQHMGEELLKLLQQHEFVDPLTSDRDLFFLFSLEEAIPGIHYHPIRWIKKTEKVQNNKTSKASLLDLLTLLGYTQEEIIGRSKEKRYKRLNDCFDLEQPFKANDFTPYRTPKEKASLKIESEYHSTLVNLVKKAGFTI